MRGFTGRNCAKNSYHGLPFSRFKNGPRVGPGPSEIPGNEQNSALVSPFQPSPWRGNPVRVRRRGYREHRNRPPAKSAHGGAALENAPADAPRGAAPFWGEDTEYAAFGLRVVPGVAIPQWQGYTTAERGGGMPSEQPRGDSRVIG